MHNLGMQATLCCKAQARDKCLHTAVNEPARATRLSHCLRLGLVQMSIANCVIASTAKLTATLICDEISTDHQPSVQLLSPINDDHQNSHNRAYSVANWLAQGRPLADPQDMTEIGVA